MHPSLMVRKTVLLKVGGYDERYCYAEDRDLLLRITRSQKLSLVAEVLLKYRNASSSVSVKSEKEQKISSCRVLYRAVCHGDCSVLFLVGVAYKALGAYMPMSVIRIQRFLWRLLGLRFVR
jgi:GT2 family glycosyltransferase